MNVDDAIQAIAARPETRLGDASAWAAYTACLAAQEAGGTPKEAAEIVAAFVEAKRRLAADLLDVSHGDA